MGFRTFTAAALCAVLASCGGGGDSGGVNAGPCVILPDGPSLTLTSATNAATGAAIPVVLLSDVIVGGLAVPALPTAAWVNIKAAGNSLECTTACGFSSSEGATTFTASAPGYASKAISTTSTYANRTGGCPGSVSNGARIAITLAPLS